MARHQLDMKITRFSAAKKRSLRPQAKFDFRSCDLSEFAAFLRQNAPEWLDDEERAARDRREVDGPATTSEESAH